MMLDSVTMDDMPELALSGPRAGIGPFETALSYIHADSHSILSLIELIVLGVGCLEIKLFSHEKNTAPTQCAAMARSGIRLSSRHSETWTNFDRPVQRCDSAESLINLSEWS